MNRFKEVFARFLKLRAVECAAAVVLVAVGVMAYRGYAVDEYDGSVVTAQEKADEFSGLSESSGGDALDPSAAFETNLIISPSDASALYSASVSEDKKQDTEELSVSLNSSETASEQDLQNLQPDSYPKEQQTVSDITEAADAAMISRQSTQDENGSSAIFAGSGMILYSGASGPGSSSGSGSISDTSEGGEDAVRVCSLLISCEPFLDDVSGSIRSRLPGDGIILPETEVEFRSGESVYDVLKRVCRAKGIPYRASDSYYGAYVSSIDNLSEKYYDYSTGWCYYVDGEYAMVSADKWQLEGGEQIDWIYDSWSM